ncbi:MAG: hypothetical protein V9F03_04645, partial [Microthrixaceae bacterium]
MTEILALHAFDDNYIWLLRARGCVAVVNPAMRRRCLPIWNAAATASAPSSPPITTATTSAAWRKSSASRPVFGPALENIAGVTPCPERRRTHRAAGNRRRTRGDCRARTYPRPHRLLSPNIDDDGALFCGDTLFGAGCG